MFADLNGLDFYFANSSCTRNDFLRLAPAIRPDHIFVVHLAADVRFSVPQVGASDEIFDKYHIPHGDGTKYVFSLCSLIPRKNLKRAVRCFLSFIEKHSIENMYFVLGGGALETEFFSEMQSCSARSEKIIVTGYIDDDDIPFLYQRAQWFVYTSRYEGFGIPPLEAMMSGCPVIVSDSSSLPEVVGNAGLLVPWNSDEAHIAAFEKMYFHEAFRKSCIEKGFAQAKKFSWEKTAHEMIEKMDAILGEDA